MDSKKLELVVYISAVLLAIGVFLPLTELPVYGEVSYNKIASVESYFVILFAVLGPALLVLNKKRLLILAPIGVWLTLLFPALKGMFKDEDDSFLSTVTDKASSVMQEYAGDLILDLFSNLMNFSWGGFIFLLALLTFTLSAIIKTLK
ncbi:hypothetical protein ACFSJ3_05680 [Corallincola platygyrae]|uniref:NADH dehydrogenase subunit 6 n=1 Tax=Corallincola platygyrae TaxID=1193278 RepID=A0ABW4XK59_9GAMM